MSNIHKVFVSYHHALDESYKKIFELRFGNAFGAIVPGSVKVGDIDPTLPTETIRQKVRDEYLHDTSVTVVLVGALTWQRKHVDWEIGSSIRDTNSNARSGLVGILLPAYYEHHTQVSRGKYNPRTIPPRLYDNIKCGFASIHHWSENAATVQDWVHQAYIRRTTAQPDNSRESFCNNRLANEWTD